MLGPQAPVPPVLTALSLQAATLNAQDVRSGLLAPAVFAHGVILDQNRTLTAPHALRAPRVSLEMTAPVLSAQTQARPMPTNPLANPVPQPTQALAAPVQPVLMVQSQRTTKLPVKTAGLGSLVQVGLAHGARLPMSLMMIAPTVKRARPGGLVPTGRAWSALKGTNPTQTKLVVSGQQIGAYGVLPRGIADVQMPLQTAQWRRICLGADHNPTSPFMQRYTHVFWGYRFAHDYPILISSFVLHANRTHRGWHHSKNYRK
eukprot:SAG31_NODE_4410_length_3255_cov_1.558935_3_plen_260_part_00